MIRSAAWGLTLTALTFSAHAQQSPSAKPIDGLDFMIEAPKLVGQRVQVAGRVDGLSFQGGFFRLPGGSARVVPPWADREDFRRLIPACEPQYFASPEDAAPCMVTVEGTVRETHDAYPVLDDVDFIFDAPAD